MYLMQKHSIHGVAVLILTRNEKFTFSLKQIKCTPSDVLNSQCGLIYVILSLQNTFDV